MLWHGLEIGLGPAFSEARPQPLTPPDPVLQQPSFVCDSPLIQPQKKRDRGNDPKFGNS